MDAHLIQKSSFVSVAMLLVREFSTYTTYLWRNFIHSFLIFIWVFFSFFFSGEENKYWCDFIFAWYFKHLRDFSIHLILSKLFQRKSQKQCKKLFPLALLYTIITRHRFHNGKLGRNLWRWSKRSDLECEKEFCIKQRILNHRDYIGLT